MFIGLSPFFEPWDKCQSLAPGIAACLGSTEDTIQMNVGRCLPQMWGLMWGYVETLASVPGKTKTLPGEP
jgi:hypothetical protein